MKKIGCSNLKSLVEEDKLFIPDYDMIAELTTFVSSGDSYAADDGSNDDLAMTLVLFAWLVDQQYFKDLMSQNIRASLYKNQLQNIEDFTVPFGHIDNGLKQRETEVDADGTVWETIS